MGYIVRVPWTLQEIISWVASNSVCRVVSTTCVILALFSFFFFISLYYRSSIGTVFDADSTKEFTTTSHGQLYKAASWNSWPKTELMALARRACWVVLLPRRLKESEIQRDEARCFQDILKVIGSPMHTHVFMFARRAKYHRPYHCPVNPVLLFQLPFS